MTFFTNFKDSAKELTKINSVVTAALLVAIHTVLAIFVSFQITPGLRISLSFLTNVITGCLYGPVMGFVCGGIGDIIQYIIKPTGPFFPGWTFNAALAGMIYGMFLYGRFPKKAIDAGFAIRCILVITLDTVIVNIFFGTLWTSVMYSKGFYFYLTTRLLKNVIQLPINAVLTYYMLWVTKRLCKQLNFESVIPAKNKVKKELRRFRK